MFITVQRWGHIVQLSPCPTHFYKFFTFKYSTPTIDLACFVASPILFNFNFNKSHCCVSRGQQPVHYRPTGYPPVSLTADPSLYYPGNLSYSGGGAELSTSTRLCDTEYESASLYQRGGHCHGLGSSYTPAGSSYTPAGSSYTPAGSSYTPAGSSYTPAGRGTP